MRSVYWPSKELRCTPPESNPPPQHVRDDKFFKAAGLLYVLGVAVNYDTIKIVLDYDKQSQGTIECRGPG